MYKQRRFSKFMVIGFTILGFAICIQLACLCERQE